MKTLIGLGICAGLFAGRAADTSFADIPVLSCSGLPCVEVRLDDGAPIRLLLDFAGFVSYVSASAMKGQQIETSRRAQLGSVILRDRFQVVDPRSEKTLGQTGRDEFPGGDGGLSLRAFAGRLFVLDLPHRRLRIWTGNAPEPSCPRHCGKVVLEREGDFVSVEIWEADGFSLNNRPVTALIDPFYPGAVIASQPIEGLLRPEWRGNGFTVPGVATPRKFHIDRLFSIGSIFVTFGGRTVCNSASLVRYDLLFGQSSSAHQATIGRAVLSRFPIAFDLRNGVMWIFDDDAKALNCD